MAVTGFFAGPLSLVGHLGGKKTTHLPNFFEVFEIFRFDFRKCFMEFLSSSSRETVKNTIKNRREKTTGKRLFVSLTFLAKSFWHGLPQKVFVVFLDSPC
jgi:hypothetical protein